MTVSVQEFWTSDRIERLKELWSAGWSASRIAAELGCSRCAVLGKKYRLGLPARPTDAWRLALGDRRKKQRPALRRIAWRPKPLSAWPRLAPSEQAEPLHLDLLDLQDGQCRWPYGEGPFTFCGCRALAGSSYCAAHALAAIRPRDGAAPDAPEQKQEKRQAA